MENNYRIAWKKLANGRTGIGNNRMTQSEAQAMAQALNEEHPDFEHIAVRSDTQHVFGLFSTDPADTPSLELHPYPGATQITPPEPDEDLVFTDIAATAPEKEALATKNGQG